MTKILVPFEKRRRKLRPLRERAYIVRFNSVDELVQAIFKLKLPLEKNAAVKGNRDLRLFCGSEFHALASLRKAGVPINGIETINALNIV